MSENTEVTNNRLTIKKSSAQILDEIFRELKEKSEKGTLLTDSDLSTVLGSTIVNEKSAITKKKEKKKKAKHKHSHKHKKRKKRKEKHPSTSSIEEWVPAETIKMNEYIANDVFESMNKNSCAHFGDSIQEPTESHNHHIKTNCEEDTTAILNFPVPINHKTECNLQNVGVDICNEFQLSSTALSCSNTNISTKFHDSMESTLIQNKLKSTVLKHMASDDVGLKQSPKRLKTSTNHCIFDKMIEDVNHKVGIPTDIAITSKEEKVGDISGPNKDTIHEQEESSVLNNVEGMNIGHEAEKLLTSEHLRSNIVKKPKEKHSSRSKKTSGRENSRSSSSTRLSPSLSSEKKFCSRSRKSRTQSLSPLSGCSVGKEFVASSKSIRCRSPSKRVSTRKTRKSRSRSSDIKQCCCSPHQSRRNYSRCSKSHHYSNSETTKSRKSESPKYRSRSSRSDLRDHSEKSPSSSSRSSRRSRDTSVFEEKIDKAKLLEIARKNAMVMMAEGKLSIPLLLEKPQPEKITAKTSEKSVEELTNFCKLLSKKEKEEEEGKVEKVDKIQHSSDDDDDKGTPFVHHPFKLRDHQPSIIMNIRNAVQLPIKTSAEKVADSAKLRIQFPVSSGTQHRKQEWVPVSPKKEKPPEVLRADSLLTPSSSFHQISNTVFSQHSVESTLDIGTIVSQRLKAVRKLMDNPNDMEALGQMYKSQQQMQSWAQSKQLPGQFTGSTDAHILTPEELAGPAHMQAWVRKDQFNRAAPVQGGFGMYMLQKMGWRPGEGLGKNKEGAAEPIILDIKTDKKGLVSHGEVARKNSLPIAKDLAGKHPVSALVELCNKRRWLPPEFVLVHDSGPDHKKNFVFKVVVNDQEYQPTIASPNKKHAKAQAATVCLQSLGLVPRTTNNCL